MGGELSPRLTTQVKHGDAPKLQRRGNLAQPGIGPAENGLIAQPNSNRIQFTDRGSNPFSIVVGLLVMTYLRTPRSTARSRRPTGFVTRAAASR